MSGTGKWLGVLACATVAGRAVAETPSAGPPLSFPALIHDTSSRAPPIPPSEKDLQTIVAQPWFSMTTEMPGFGMDESLFIEGPIFDKQGNLLFVEVNGGRVLRLSPDRNLTVVLPKNDYGSAGLGLHKDGRILVAGVGDHVRGSVFAIRSDGSDKQVIIDPKAGYVPDDIAMDNHGGFYFTDFRGNIDDPKGGVFHVGPDMKTIIPMVTRMSRPNGIALSQDGKILWFGETGKGLLHRIALSAPTKIATLGSWIPYHFNAKVDSLRVDGDGNVYAALVGEGRVMVFDPNGSPIGQILIPDRDRGQFLFTTSMAIKPGTRELYILSSDRDGRKANIYRAGAFAKAPIPPDG